MNIAVQRLHNQQLESSKFKTPAEVVKRLAVVQAQDYAGGKWSIGLRLPGSTDSGVEQAITDKTIVRTWALRGTLHFVALTDIRWLLALVAPRIVARTAGWYRKLELDEPTLTRSNAALTRALQGGRQLNRTQLLGQLERKGISTKGLRAVYMLQKASLDGLICQSEMRRNNPTYLSLNDLHPGPNNMDREEALELLARRYFETRGPATLDDFVWWSGLTVGDARVGLERIKSRLAQATIDSKPYWMGAQGKEQAARRKGLQTRYENVQHHSPVAYLLSGYDEYLLSYKDRGASLDALDAKRLGAGNGFLSTIVMGGRVVGTWRRRFKNGGVVIESNPFKRMTYSQHRALAAAGRRYGEFLEMPVVLE